MQKLINFGYITSPLKSFSIKIELTSSISASIFTENSMSLGLPADLISCFRWILQACNLRCIRSTFWMVVLGIPSSKLLRTWLFRSSHTRLSQKLCAWPTRRFKNINNDNVFKLFKPPTTVLYIGGLSP